MRYLTLTLGALLACASSSLHAYRSVGQAASFIYIAIADLMPGLHQAIGPKVSLAQSLMIGLGIGTMSTTISLLI